MPEKAKYRPSWSAILPGIVGLVHVVAGNHVAGVLWLILMNLIVITEKMDA